MLLKKKIKEYNLVENRLKTDLKIRVQIHIKVFGHIRDCVLVNTSEANGFYLFPVWSNLVILLITS